MNKEQLFAMFRMMFPEWAKMAVSYKKIGSRCLAITFQGGKSRVFMYYNADNWQFGTKLYRKRIYENKKGDQNNE